MTALEGFRGRMAKRVGSTGTPLVLALDLIQKQDESRDELKSRAIKLIQETSDSLSAIKINAQLLLPLGLNDGVAEINRSAHAAGLQTIMDAKLNDVGHTNAYMAKMFFEAGFDAIIANPIVGWEEGMQAVFEEASSHQGGVILLVYLSHRSAVAGYGLTVQGEDGATKPLYRLFAERALEWNAEGIIVGATHPEKITEVAHHLNGRIPIYTPGVGTQGGSLEAALSAGATYPIIGRSIIESENPRQTALVYKDTVMKSRSPTTY